MMALGCVVPAIRGNARSLRSSPLQKLAKERCFSGVISGVLSLAEFRFTSGNEGLGFFGARGPLADICTGKFRLDEASSAGLRRVFVRRGLIGRLRIGVGFGDTGRRNGIDRAARHFSLRRGTIHRHLVDDRHGCGRNRD